MRLLQYNNDGEFSLTQFFGAIPLPPYAILSHTWGRELEEVTFQDMMEGNGMSKAGFGKIRFCGEQARRDGFSYFWVDTCCIDKSSSAELSEAINSMFSWYKNSAVCYVFIDDIIEHKDLVRSRWITIGWTLQELIAPSKVEFYNSRWNLLGTKKTLQNVITSITGIQPDFLCGADLETASVAKKMSWAAKRTTTRVEDVAYSLLGIFDINMPLLYGEGIKAFRRLQEEIIKLYPEDQSLYAWGDIVEKCSYELQYGERISRRHLHPVAPLLGLLADSPRAFKNSGSFVPVNWIGEFYSGRYRNDSPARHPAIIGKDITLELPVAQEASFRYCYEDRQIAQTRGGIYAMLLCCDESKPKLRVSIPLLGWGHSLRGRTKQLVVNTETAPTIDNYHSFPKDRMRVAAERQKQTLCDGDVIIDRLTDLKDQSQKSSHPWVHHVPNLLWNWNRVAQLGNAFTGRFLSMLVFGDQVSSMDQYWLTLSRVVSNNKQISDPHLHVGIIRLNRKRLRPEEEDVPLFEHTFQPLQDEWRTSCGPVSVSILVERVCLSPGSFFDCVNITLSLVGEGIDARFNISHQKLGGE
ncbi:HET-domain-containing protein [Hyaloscypha variabilis F]|uniref:HET-domain-containing protein n=1 Tax=Hyaloscypha variabilis (strain UAMH 11265 / GT02V1 / F) TaxID=1149755 RepID=A0A2J6QUL2_HYAVF|nr:HET-domain-containing protein [Hyaloscypha variabilis F]